MIKTISMTSITMVNVLMSEPPKILRFMRNIVPFFKGKCKRFVYYLIFYKRTADS